MHFTWRNNDAIITLYMPVEKSIRSRQPVAITPDLLDEHATQCSRLKDFGVTTAHYHFQSKYLP